MVQLVQRASDVRVTEINLSSVITSNSITSACLAVISNQGSIGPRHFTNAQDFIAEYGNPNPAVSMTIQSGLNYFNEGSDMWAVRAVNAGYATAGALLVVSTAGVVSLHAMGIEDPTHTDLSTLVTGTDQAVAFFYASRGPGSYGNELGISLHSLAVTTPTNFAANSVVTGGTLSNATYAYMIAALGSTGESLASAPLTITLAGLSGSTGVNHLTWNAVAGAIGYNLYGRVTGGGFGLIATLGGGTLTFSDTGAITPDTTKQPITSAGAAAASSEFVVSIWDTSNPTSLALETWTCTLGPAISASGTQMQLDDAINPFSSYIQVVNDAAALVSMPVVNEIAKTSFSGGASGTLPTSYNVAAALQVFKNKALYRVNTFINGGIADPIVQLAMDTLVQSRGDSVALLDVPSARQNFQAAVDYRNLTLNLNSTYSALFCPDLLQADMINGKQVYNPPSGWAAALCARTDRVANQAYSIAGLNRGILNVLKARHDYDDGQASNLYQAQVNYSRNFVGQGIALWEQQTLSAQQSALSWLSVRRITNVIKVSLYNFLLYALQEMNNDQIRRQIVNSFNSYLGSIKSSQGLSDFRVVCDSTNNTPATFNAGVLVVTVILLPMIPIHEIQLQVVISKAGVSFSEVLNQVTGNTQ